MIDDSRYNESTVCGVLLSIMFIQMLFRSSSGNMITRHTTPTSLFNHLWVDPTGTSIQFSVQSCFGARIALSAVRGQTDSATYMVVIGGDSNTE